MRKFLASLLALFVLAGVAACGSSSPSSSGSTSSPGGTRSVKHLKGTATLPEHPQRIVSTSVVLTGTLLALDAPVVGSGGSKPNVAGLDSHGWWTHWSAIAEQRKVQSLFTNGKLDLEAIAAAKPDVILVSATGGDSFIDNYEQLARIAPTLVIDYNTRSWEEVTTQLGADLNLASNATKVLDDYKAYAAQAKQKITPPAKPVDIAVYGGDNGLSVGLPTAPQARALSEIGIKVADTGITPEKGRTDFGFTTPEQALKALTAPQMLLVGNDENDLKALMADAKFATLPSVKARAVHPLGLASFKLDYYAAKDLIDHAVDVYGK